MICVPLLSVKDEALADELRSRGWRCERDDGSGWMAPSALSLECGRAAKWLSDLLSVGTRPPGLEIERARGGKGRIARVRPSASFRTWAAELRRDRGKEGGR